MVSIVIFEMGGFFIIAIVSGILIGFVGWMWCSLSKPSLGNEG
jgi:hypothetical protein